MKLLDLDDLSAAEIRTIWTLASAPPQRLSGTVGWSFEGNGIRTRTTFIEAFRTLGLDYVELPHLLKTGERACDLAGYLDPFYAAYVVRESNHERLREFAAASARPVINAMSRLAHPCEVLADAQYIDTHIRPLHGARIGLWGPTTNVFRSWHALASVMGLTVRHFCGPDWHSPGGRVVFSDSATEPVDVLITDGWPGDFDDPAWSLTREHLAQLGHPRLLPTPPFSIGRELAFDPVGDEGFLGYGQKRALLEVQRGLLMYALGC